MESSKSWLVSSSAALLLLAGGGCIPHGSDLGAKSGPKPLPVRVVYTAPTPFEVRVQAHAGGGSPYDPRALGLVYIHRYAVQDPIQRVRDGLIQRLSRDRDLHEWRVAKRRANEEDLRETGNSPIGRLLIFRTTDWALQAHPQEANAFSVTLSAEAQLIDVDTFTPLATVSCRYPDRPPAAPTGTQEQFQANDAQFLKTELQKAAQHCSEVLADQLLAEPRFAALWPL